MGSMLAIPVVLLVCGLSKLLTISRCHQAV